MPTTCGPLQAKTPIIDVSGRVNAALLEYFGKHPSALKTMDRRLFEELIAELWRRFGYEVELTKRTRDGGRDIVAISNREVRVKYLIECKRPDRGTLLAYGPFANSTV